MPMNLATRNGSARLAAQTYIRAGLCPIPIRADGSKAPALREWTSYQTRLPTEEEIANLFSGHVGVAIVGGAVSGNLECLDFDTDADRIFPEWRELVEFEAPGLYERLSVATTPKPGFHVRYRCETPVPGNDKLAEDPTARGKERTLIETRGQAGYALAPGCPPECHQLGKTYDHFSGPQLSQVQTITAAEREVLIRCARSFDRSVVQDAAANQNGMTTTPNAGNRPGDHYNCRGPAWADVLEPHGWVHVKGFLWRRPGKNFGWSATVGYCKNKDGQDLLAVFSSNAEPFEGMVNSKPSCYGKFSAYALLNHKGDFSAATKELAAQGYGEQTAKPTHVFRDGHIFTPIGKSGATGVAADSPPPPLPIVSCADLVSTYLERRPPVIEGLLRVGETMNVIAAPKIGKSWLTQGLAYAVATGSRWLGIYPTVQGRVLLIDNELHRETSAHRLRTLAEALHLPHLEDVPVDVINLRGRLMDLYSLGSGLKQIPHGTYKLVIVDAFYRTLPAATDENSNAAMAGLYNHLDAYAEALGAAFVVIHHASKGAQNEKAVTDVGAGAGAQARATDTHLILRPHEEDSVVVLEATTRSWAPVQPVCLRWNFPLWTPAPDLDPSQLRTNKPRRRKIEEEAAERKPEEPPWTAQRFAKAFVKPEPQARGKILEAAQLMGLSDRKIKDLFKNAEDCGYLHTWRGEEDNKVLVSSEPRPELTKSSSNKLKRGRPPRGPINNNSCVQ
jgi:hypothetical protein